MHTLCLIDSSLLSTNIQSINQIQQLVTKHTVYLITHDCISKGNLCTYIKTNIYSNSLPPKTLHSLVYGLINVQLDWKQVIST